MSRAIPARYGDRSKSKNYDPVDEAYQSSGFASSGRKPTGGGIENEQTFACFEAPLLAANGPHTSRCRLRAGAFRALRVARHGRHQDAVDRAMEPLRSRVRQVVRQVRQGLGGEESDITSPSTTSPCRTSPRARPPRRRPDPGHDLFEWNGAGGPHLYRKFLIDMTDLVQSVEQEARQGQRHRPTDRLQPGRQDLVGVSRLLHQFPGHVSQEPVGRRSG